MITAETLLADGFREFQIPVGSQHHKSADRFFQRCIWSDNGRTKLYYVDVYLYDWRRFDRPGPPESLLFSVWAYTDDSRSGHIKLDYSPETEKPLGQVLTYLHRAWEALSGVPYEDQEAA